MGFISADRAFKTEHVQKTKTILSSHKTPAILQIGERQNRAEQAQRRKFQNENVD